MLAIDLSKAFDSVNLPIMIEKLRELGVDGIAIKLFESFLIDRKQYVEIKNCKSSIKTIRTGVPQGSKLAATLFLIYINNILKLNLKGMPQFYADDGTFLYATNSLDELLTYIQEDLNIISQWFERNLLKMNLAKTNFIIFNNYRDIPSIHDLKGVHLDGSFISRVDTLKYLGIWFDANLNWREHINRIKMKLLPLNFAIYRNRKVIPQKQLWLLYNSLFMSKIHYLNPIWNNCSEQLTNEIQRIQNKVIKIFCICLEERQASSYIIIGWIFVNMLYCKH